MIYLHQDQDSDLIIRNTGLFFFFHPTFWSTSWQVIGTCRNGHLYGCRRRNYSAVMVVMETDALVFSWGKDSTGHYLCSFLDLIKQWVTASWNAQVQTSDRDRRWAWMDLCLCAKCVCACVTHLSPASLDCIQNPAFLTCGKFLSPYLNRKKDTEDLLCSSSPNPKNRT